MNLPNKLSISRIILSIFIIIVLLFPFSQTSIELPMLFVNELLVVDTRYVIAGVLFILAVITDIYDGKIAKKKHIESDYGKLLDKLADKVLLYPVLIILASQGFIHSIIPIIFIVRDACVSCIKNTINSTDSKVNKLDKIQSILCNIGLILVLFYNLPFEIYNLKVADAILMVSCILSLVTLIQFYNDNEKILKKLMKN